MRRSLLVVVLVVVFIAVNVSSAAKKKNKGLILRQKETNPVNFIRLAIMRLIYGLASRFGYEEQISEFMNGAFVPPGVDDYGDYNGLFSREDDYDDY